MNFDAMNQCADLIFADAVQDLSRRSGKSVDEIRARIIESPAYEALYDFETGVWQTGPDYFIGLVDTDDAAEKR